MFIQQSCTLFVLSAIIYTPYAWCLFTPSIIISKLMIRKFPSFARLPSQRRAASDLITAANIDFNNILLPKWHIIEGVVKSGYGRGSKTLGFPTANLPQFESFLTEHNMQNGVYCGWALIANSTKLVGCVSNIGLSPTFVGQENPKRIIETYVFDRDNCLPDFYGQYMRLLLTGYIRPEKKYNSLNDLIAQIQNDVDIGRTFNERICNGDIALNPSLLQNTFTISSESLSIPLEGDEKTSWKVVDWSCC